jgi:hypothetical protein
MRKLHPAVASTAKEVIIKENDGFRLRLEKWESISPQGVFAVDLIQESLGKDGIVQHASTYNFNMTKEELERLAKGLIA